MCELSLSGEVKGSAARTILRRKRPATAKRLYPLRETAQYCTSKEVTVLHVRFQKDCKASVNSTGAQNQKQRCDQIKVVPACMCKNVFDRVAITVHHVPDIDPSLLWCLINGDHQFDDFQICDGRKLTTTAMAPKQARLVVLGSKDFEGFTELEGLPDGVKIVGLGSAAEILGRSYLAPMF